MRAVLGHGAVLRQFVLERVPAGEPPHTTWEALRDWIEGLSDDTLRALVDLGIRSNLEAYRHHSEPTPEVERWLDVFETDAPPESSAEDQMRHLAAARAVLASWGVARTEAALALIGDPERLRQALIRFLDDLWEAGFGEEWEARRRALETAAEAAQTSIERAGGRTVEGMLIGVTGLQPEGEILAAVRRASHIVLVPTVNLSHYLSLVESGERCYLLYEPPATGARRPAPPEGQVLDLAWLGPAVEALGDVTRLTILLALAQREEMFAQEIALETGVHQSTVSRHLTQLQRAGLVSVRREGSMKFYRVDRRSIREIGEQLLHTLG
jgi:DNA-binding transcriptional ArsR family regulator